MGTIIEDCRDHYQRLHERRRDTHLAVSLLFFVAFLWLSIVLVMGF